MQDQSNISLFKRLLIGAGVAGMLWLSAGQAQASDLVGSPFEGRAGAGLLLTTSAIGFGLVDILYLAHDRPLPTALAVAQIAVAGVVVPLTALNADHTGITLFAGISSAWFTGHGVYSFIANAQRNRERERALAEARAWRAACVREPDSHSLLCAHSR